jgi:hypothetical protein
MNKVKRKKNIKVKPSNNTLIQQNLNQVEKNVFEY